MARRRASGVQVEVLDRGPGGGDLHAHMARLGSDGVVSVLVEGAAGVLGAAFYAGLVDKVRRHDGAASPLLRDVSVEAAGPYLVVTGYCVR